MQNEIKTAIAKKMIISNRNITIKDIIEQLEKQGIVNSGESNSETGQVKTQPDGYVYEITEKANGDWEVTYIGNGEITIPEIVITLTANTTGLTNEVIITMTAKAESGITSYTLPMKAEQSVDSVTKEVTQTYTATKNGTYVFTVKNGNGNTVTKSIAIDNILQNTIQMSASTTEYTYSNVVVTITWPERSSGAVKQIKIGEGAWQTVTGSTTQITVNQNTTIKVRIQNSITDIMSNTLTIDNILQSGIIPISTKEQLLKIGTGEVLEIDGKLYAFGISDTYELKNDFEFTGDYRETASRIQNNNIPIKGNSYQIVVTTAEGVQEYYTEHSKYYIATNKYGYVLDGLVAYYDGIDNTGTGTHDRTATVWKDLSGNGNDAVLNNFGITPTSGWGNNYLSFDGVNDWVNCGEINNDYTTLDIAYLLKSEYEYSGSILGNWSSGGCGIGVTYGKSNVSAYIDGAYRSINNEEAEHHTIRTSSLTYDGDTLEYFLDGNKKNELSYRGVVAPPDSGTFMALGVNPSPDNITQGEFTGFDVYSARIYNRSLTAEEISINSKADERRYKQEEIIPIYTEEQLLKIGSGESIYVEQENKTYEFKTNSKYEYKNNIEISSNYATIQEKIKAGEIFIKLNENYIKSSDNYYTYKSQYTIAENKYGYVKENLQLLLDGIDNTGSGHSTTTPVWKDLSGNNRNGTLLPNVKKNNMEIKEKYGATWLKVFYHKSNSGTVVFSSESEVLSCDTATKYSMLDTLEEYRNSNGEFEFLLEYPELTGYNRWKQTSNPTTIEESVTGYNEVSITWKDYSWGGLCKSSSTSTFIDGSVNNSNWYYAIGAYKAWNSGIPSTNIPVDEVCLWVRIDNLENTGWTEEGLKFDGINDYVSIAEMNYSNITMETVISSTINENAQYIISNIEGGGYRIRINGTGRICFGPYITEESTYVEPYFKQMGGDWNNVEENIKYSTSGLYNGHRIITRTNGQYEYLDVEGTIGTPKNNTYIVLGSNPSGSVGAESWFKGTIYSARIYNRALTDEEMSVNYLNDKERYKME